MAISIAILGASGSVGTALAAHLLRSGLLEPGWPSSLVGQAHPHSEVRLLATRIDLLDAFDDGRVEVEVVPQIADLDADIVVIASGVGISPRCTNRRDMGAMNLDLFQRIAVRMRCPGAGLAVRCGEQSSGAGGADSMREAGSEAGRWNGRPTGFVAIRQGNC